MKKFPILAKLKSLRTDVDSLNDSIATKLNVFSFVAQVSSGSSNIANIDFTSYSAGLYMISAHKTVAFVTKDSSEIVLLGVISENASQTTKTGTFTLNVFTGSWYTKAKVYLIGD